MSLDRHGRKLQPDWLAEALGREAVIPALGLFGRETQNS